MIEVRQDDIDCFDEVYGNMETHLADFDVNELKMAFARCRQQAEDAMRERVDDLRLAAKRVDRKYGHYEDGEPCDWSEWQDLRTAIRGIDAGGEDQADPSG